MLFFACGPHAINQRTWTPKLTAAQLENTYEREGFSQIDRVVASADGRVVAVELAKAVHVLRRVGDDYQVQAIDGELLRSRSPLVGRRTAEGLEIEQLGADAIFSVPVAVDDDPTEEPGLSQWQRSDWHTSTSAPARGLLRAFPSFLTWYRAKDPKPVWHKSFGDGPSLLTAELSADGSTAVVMRGARGKAATLSAYETDTGAERWAISLGGEGIPVLRITPDGTTLVALSYDKARCDDCEQAQLIDTKSGARLNAFALANKVGDQWIRSAAYDSDTQVAFTGERLWFYRQQEARDGGRHHGGRAQSCHYELYDTAAGKRVRTQENASSVWREQFEGCAIRAMLQIVSGGTLTLRKNSALELSLSLSDSLP